MTDQTLLEGFTPNLSDKISVPIEDFDLDYAPPPSAALVESIRKFGILHPLVVVISRSHGSRPIYRVTDGRRRLAAATKAGLTRVPVLILRNPSQVGTAAVTLTVNANRSANPQAELEAIQSLEAEGASEQEIAEATGFTRQTIRARMRLLRLADPLLKAFFAGEIGVSAAEAAAKLDQAKQKDLIEALDAGEKITLETVKAAKRVRGSEQVAMLPDDLFEQESPLETVRTFVSRAREAAQEAGLIATMSLLDASLEALVREQAYMEKGAK